MNLAYFSHRERERETNSLHEQQHKRPVGYEQAGPAFGSRGFSGSWNGSDASASSISAKRSILGKSVLDLIAVDH